jgi:hypothetical protein
LLKWAQWAQIDIRGMNGELKTATELYLELADKMKALSDAGKPQAAFTMANAVGVPAGMIPMLMQGRQYSEELLKNMREVGSVTQEQSAQAIKFENAWVRAWVRIQAAVREFYPILTDLGNALTLAFSPKALAVYAQGLRSIVADFKVAQSWISFDKASVTRAAIAEADSERAKWASMQKDLDDWKSGEGGKKYTGADVDKFMNQAGTDAPAAAGAAPTSVPAEVPMTDRERDELALIRKHESAGRNVMNYIGDAGHTAQGYYQITNTNWRRLAPGLGITAPNAMAASDEDQTRVALALRRESGMGNWANYNPSLRAAMNNMPAGGNAAFADALRGLGPDRLRGLRGGAAASAAASSTDNSRSSTSTSDVTINGGVHINAPQATDAKGIAGGIREAMKSSLYTLQADGGPHG